MRDACDAVLKLAAHDPVIAIGLALIALFVVPLCGIHVCRIFGGFLVVLIREFKHELLGVGKILGRVRHELTSWKVDE